MKILFVLLSFLAFSSFAEAQTKIKPEDMEIRDSSGIVYPLAIWQNLIMSGKYGIHMLADSKTGVIGRLSEEEVARRFSRMPKPPESNFFTTGETLKSFSERDMNGVKYNLKELAGKVVALNFWFINCGPCRREMPDLNEMVESFKGNKDVVFIAVSLDRLYEIKDFLKTNPFIYNIIDDGRYIASKYNVTLYPTHVVLGRQGKVIFHTSGVASNTVGWVKISI